MKHKGFSITAVLGILFGTGAWQKENIFRMLNPPISITQEEYKVANSENFIIEKQLALFATVQNKKLNSINDKLDVMNTRLTVIETYFMP
jgi:hypothetical protein